MALKTSLVIGGDAQDAIAALIGFEQRLAKAEASARKLGTANEEMGQKAVKASGLAQAGYINLGRQAQDVAVQLQGGANIGLIIGQQSSQIIDAFQMIAMAQSDGQGRFAKFANFLSGPWGIALTIATSVAVTLAGSLFDVADASKEAEKSADALAKRQMDIKNFFDLSTGAIKENNSALIQNAILLRDSAMKDRIKAGEDRIVKANKILAESQKPQVIGVRTFASATGGGVVPIYGKPNDDIARAVQSPEMAKRLREIGASNSSNAARARELSSLIAQGAYDKQEQARDKKETASLETGILAPGLRTPKKGGTPKRSKGSGNAAARAAEFAEDTAAKIAGIKDEFSDLPSAVEKSNAALRKLNDIASDIEKKKGPNYDKMRADIEGARKAINDSLTKPFNDFLEKARAGEQIDQLLLQGKEDQADALQVILGLEERMRPLKAEELETVLATVEAERRRSAVLRDQREIISAQVDAVHDMRGALQQTVANALRGRFSLGSILSSGVNSYIDIVSKKTVEAMFGSTLRKLEEEASGQSTLRKASDAMAGELGKTGTAAKDLATAFREAISTIKGTSPAPQTGSDTPADPDEIVVTARRPAQVDGKSGSLMVSMADQLARQVGIKVPPALVEGAKKLLGKLETGLPNILGTALVGASVGQAVFGNSKGAGIGGAIGGVIGKEVGKMVGAKIGGTLGKALGPLGSIAGSLLGAGLGKLMSGVKTGTATVGNSSGRGQVTGTGGNSASRVSAARGLASGALSALDQIVEQLGGQLGDFSGSIGVRKSKFVVDPTGRGRTKGSGTQSFATEAEAQQALLADMIADGAVKGVSAAVQRALTASGDVEQRLKEALKVQEIELAIGGIGGALEKEFRTFERQAAERLRIAKEYGFDVVKVEEQNAKDRLKLSQKLLAEQVGSLQDLINDMTSGSLFEGSAVDRRTALLDKIAGARADVAAGTEGAADKLANLLDQLNTVSKEAFATTGTFAADRASILDEARGAIAKANERITAAQAATDPALATTNAALNENNDQNAQMIAALNQNNVLLQQLLKGGLLAGGGTGYLAALAGTSNK